MRIKKLTLLAILATTLSGCSHITKQDSWNFIKSVGEAAWEETHEKECRDSHRYGQYDRNCRTD